MKNPVAVPLEKCWEVPRKHCQSVPVKKPRIVTKTVPRKACEYGGGGYGDGGSGYDAAHGHKGGYGDHAGHGDPSGGYDHHRRKDETVMSDGDEVNNGNINSDHSGDENKPTMTLTELIKQSYKGISDKTDNIPSSGSYGDGQSSMTPEYRDRDRPPKGLMSLFNTNKQILDTIEYVPGFFD